MPAEMNKPLTVSVERLLARKSYALFLVCSVCAVALLTWLTLGHFEKILLPQLLAKSNYTNDQGHIATKTYDFERTISLTLGVMRQP